MFEHIKKMVIIGLVFLALIFVLFIINQTNQVVGLVTGVHPTLGRITL